MKTRKPCREPIMYQTDAEEGREQPECRDRELQTGETGKE
jgi:hypothetical protein